MVSRNIPRIIPLRFWQTNCFLHTRSVYVGRYMSRWRTYQKLWFLLFSTNQRALAMGQKICIFCVADNCATTGSINMFLLAYYSNELSRAIRTWLWEFTQYWELKQSNHDLFSLMLIRIYKTLRSRQTEIRDKYNCIV